MSDVEREEFDPKADIGINPDNILEEAVRHPRVAFHYSERLADLAKELRDAQSNLDVVKSELILDMRRNPTKFDLGDKPTDKSVEAASLSHPDYDKALLQVSQLERDVATAKNFVSALVDKRRSLELVVELMKINYHAETPIMGTEAREAITEQNKRAARVAADDPDEKPKPKPKKRS
jgi:hypothetical protein